MKAKNLPELMAAREQIVLTAIQMRNAQLVRDSAYLKANRDDAPLAFMHRANRLSEKFEAAELVHLKSIEKFFALCKKFNVEPH